VLSSSHHTVLTCSIDLMSDVLLLLDLRLVATRCVRAFARCSRTNYAPARSPTFARGICECVHVMSQGHPSPRIATLFLLAVAWLGATLMSGFLLCTWRVWTERQHLDVRRATKCDKKRCTHQRAQLHMSYLLACLIGTRGSSHSICSLRSLISRCSRTSRGCAGAMMGCRRCAPCTLRTGTS